MIIYKDNYWSTETEPLVKRQFTPTITNVIIETSPVAADE
jgi:hypothetical protein